MYIYTSKIYHLNISEKRVNKLELKNNYLSIQTYYYIN